MTKRKIWILATVLCLALCLAVCFAAAEGTKTKPDERSVVSSSIAEKGETVTISTGIGSGYEAIKLVVKDTNGWAIAHTEVTNVSNAVDGRLSFTVNTSNSKFEAGHLYLTELMALPTADSAPDTWDGYWDSVLTVVPVNTTGLNLFLTMTEVETGYDGMFVTAYDPGAENVWIVVDGEAYQNRPGNSNTWVGGYYEPGSHTVKAISIDANGNKTTSQEKTFTVSQNESPTLYPANETPVTFTMGGETKSLAEFPETITAGTDISYTIHRVTKDLGTDAAGLDQQVWYDSWLDDFTDWDASIELPCFEKRYEPEVPHKPLMNNETGDRTITIDHNQLVTGHTYQLNVEIRSAGQTTVWYSKTFVVLPASMNNQGITLSFTGNDAGKSSVNYPVYDDFILHANAPGATLVRFWAADHFEYLNNWTGRIAQEEFDIEWKTWWTSEFKYYVQAYYGEIGETPWDQLNWDAARTSNILTVKAVRDDTVESIKPTFNALSDTVQQGDYFTVTITNADDLDSAGIYVGANLYNGNDIDNHYDRTGNQIKVPTTDLEPGYYILGIYAETTGGDYLQNYHCFRVIAPDIQPENNFMITTTVPVENGVRTVTSYEDFSVSFYAPDMDGYNKYYRFFDGQGWWWDNWFERSVTLDAELDPGTWEIYAEVVYQPKDENSEELRYESEHIQITATSRGDSHILLDAPGSYTVGGEGYTVSIKNTQNDQLINPEQYKDEYWEVILEEVHGEGHMEFRRDNGDQLQSSFTFPDNQFTAGRTYKVRLHLNVPGYDPVDDEVRFVAVDPQAVNQQKLELAVNEYNTGSYVAWYAAHTDFNVKVTKSNDITAVRVLNGDNWEIWWGDDSYERDWSFSTGIYGLVAQGTTDSPRWEEDGFDWGKFDWNEDVNWSITSNTVTVRVNAPNGKLGRPTLTLDRENKTYTRGEKITATVGNVDGSEWYDLHVAPSDEYGNEQGGWVYDTHMDATDAEAYTFTVPTSHMEPGTYVIWVDNNGTGYNGNGSNGIVFTVTAGSQDPQAVLDLPEEISTNQNIRFYAYVPNADDIWVDIRKQGESGWRQDKNNGGNYAEWEFGEAFRGTYVFTLYGHVNDEEVLAAGPVALEVRADNGDLNEATISLDNSVITIDTNGASSGVRGSFIQDFNAEWYQVRLVYRGPTGDWGDNEIRNDFRDGDSISNRFAFDISDFNRGAGVYEIQVTGGATGYNGTGTSAKILALEATETTDKTVELYIYKDNSTTGPSLSFQANENMTVKIHAKGATAIRLFDGNRWDWWDSRCLDENGWTEFGWSFDSGNYTFIAQAAYDTSYDWDNFDNWENFDAHSDLHWTALSKAVQVSVTAQGVTDAPVIADIGTVTRGELLAVTVTSAGSENSPKRATSLDAFIQHEDGWNAGDGMGSGYIESYPYTFQFPTGNMEPGQYYVYVHSHALGYNTGEACMAFEVADPEEEDPFIFEVQDGLYADQEFSMSAYAEGASWIDVYVQGEDNDEPLSWGPFPGDHIYNTGSRLNGGYYEIWAVAHYTDEQGQETGSRMSGRISRQVQWLGKLEDPVINALSSYSTSTGGSFTVSNLDQNCFWWVEVFDMDEIVEYEDGSNGWELIAQWNADGGIPESFPISIQDLTAGHAYRINANVRQDGYEEGFDWKEFIATGAASDQVTLSVEVEAGDSLSHWPSSKNLDLIINAPGASAIRVWNGNHWEYHDSNCEQDDGKYYKGININDVGEYTLVAQACYDKNDDGSSINWNDVDFSQFDWGTLHWADMSNAISVTVYAEGQLNEATYTAPGAVKPGQDLVITITNPIEGQWYNASLRSIPDRWNMTDYIGMQDDNTITIPTAGIDSGAYELCVWTDAEGWLGRESNSLFIIDDLSGASVFTLPAGITAVEEEAFDGVRMEVVVIQGNHPNLDLNFLNSTGTRYLVAGDGCVTVPRFHSYEVISPGQFNILK